MDKKYDALKLENQLCFPLYAAAREVLKSLEAKGYVTRKRSTTDERSVSVFLTSSGETLREKAVDIPAKVAGCVDSTAKKRFSFTDYCIRCWVLGRD